MRLINYCFIILLGEFLCVNIIEGYTSYDAARLQSDLLTNYSSKVRPSATTNVSLSLGLMHISELNIVTQTLHCVGFIVARWNDDRLTWNPTDYDNMTEVFIPLSDIWSPPLLLNNAADEIKIMNDNSDLSSLNAYIFFVGTSIWLAPSNFRAQCTINIRYYPFDSQSCDIVVSSWLFLEMHMRITSVESSINFDIYQDNGEWEVTGSSVKDITRILSGHHMPAVKFTINMSRKYSYYLMNMLLPVIILAMMAPFVFLLPPASGEKIGYALTILLSLSVVMTLVSDNIPPTSTNICILSVYLLMIFIICSLETLLTVWTCSIHDMRSKHIKMGRTMMRLTRFLAIVTRYRRNCKQDKLSNNVVTLVNDVKMDNSEEKKTVTPKAWNQNAPKHGNLSDDVTEYTYEELAELFDRANFWLFFVITIVVTMVIMIILQVGGKS